MSKIIHTTLFAGGEDKPKVYFLKGLPASGKTTWALENASSVNIRLNNDVFRTMMTGDYSDQKEGVVNAGIRAAGMDALNRGLNIIVDNTNLSDKHKNFWIQYCSTHNITLEELFFDTSLELCIERDSHRPDGQKVGEGRIKEMHDNAFGPHTMRTVVAYRYQDPTLHKAVIVDIDGTLAFMNDRGCFDYSKVDTDIPNLPIIELVNQLQEDYAILLVSGREGTADCYSKTLRWLIDNGIEFDDIFMRKEGDKRKDSIVKRELFEKHIEGSYNVLCVIDDRDRTVEMWRKELNLPCLQVNYGNF